jgi:hypothetical protein
MTTKEEAIRGAGTVLAEARRKRDALGPRTAAQRAWYQGHPLTVKEIEALIVRHRDEAALPQDIEGIPEKHKAA